MINASALSERASLVLLRIYISGSVSAG